MKCKECSIEMIGGDSHPGEAICYGCYKKSKKKELKKGETDLTPEQLAERKRYWAHLNEIYNPF